MTRSNLKVIVFSCLVCGFLIGCSEVRPAVSEDKQKPAATSSSPEFDPNEPIEP
jgi:hypothetical protein